MGPTQQKLRSLLQQYMEENHTNAFSVQNQFVVFTEKTGIDLDALSAFLAEGVLAGAGQ